mmetsp:Transcript_18822/g.52489  ORF Transcript_18822/g.52489 Transcript_18822/m.52489 type:complete len:547 (-) Transcript_18822:205-1845(-)|eukprot:CAMPEP_0117669070 /NCGR_PEP_ID=MMETSP0804-20121206/11912_1 /TAXON_ID=1074897 /ORGANISM="Tetraselmis astigmatica, Strain CCMP880" /LENGTH=546 /DNA_ID=CAMNT_0005477055 /DNA_START=178 /DNA_END=1818 /DNA_ORIENTATION=-
MSDADLRSGSSGYAALLRTPASRGRENRDLRARSERLRWPAPRVLPTARAFGGRNTRSGGDGANSGRSGRAEAEADAEDEQPSPSGSRQHQTPQMQPCRWEVPAGTVVRSASGAVNDGRDELLAQVGHLQVGPGLKVRYVGPGQQDSDAALILADRPVPRDRPLYCFEVEILNKGAEGFIGIGLAKRGITSNCLPGWKPGSYGYHGDDGKIFNGVGNGESFGPTFSEGDVISCIWCEVDRTISFAKNGVFLGVAFRNVQETRLYPTIGLRTLHEEVEANFGSIPLRSNVHETVLRDLSDATANEIARVTIPLAPWAARAPASMHDVVHAYLQHSGYPGAAAAMADAQLGCIALPDAERDSAAKDAEARAEVQAAVMAGDIDRAQEAMEAIAPGLLQEDADIRFRLNCQRFMEMCKAGNDAAAISFGLEHLSESSRSHPAGAEMLADAAVMLAFPGTTAGTLDSNELRLSYRRALASAINSALQVRAGRPPHSALERILAQLHLVYSTLKSEGDTLMMLVDLESHGLNNQAPMALPVDTDVAMTDAP